MNLSEKLSQPIDAADQSRENLNRLAKETRERVCSGFPTLTPKDCLDIRPTQDGGCPEDESCPNYDGKRCMITGSRPRGCAPYIWELTQALGRCMRLLKVMGSKDPIVIAAREALAKTGTGPGKVVNHE